MFGKKIAIFGFAFKADTNDTRESPAIDIVTDLLDEKANVVIYDPKVSEESIKNELKISISNLKIKNDGINKENFLDKWTYCKNIQDAYLDADALVFLTEWKEFENIDWSEVAPLMKYPAWVFDCRSIVNKIKIKNAGINLWSLGKG